MSEFTSPCSPCWSFDLRSCHNDGSGTEGSPHTEHPTSEDARLAKELDLSSRYDQAEFKPNPWSIAKVNAGSRNNGTRLSTSVRPKRVDNVERSKCALALAFEAQSRRMVPQTGRPLLKPQDHASPIRRTLRTGKTANQSQPISGAAPKLPHNAFCRSTVCRASSDATDQITSPSISGEYMRMSPSCKSSGAEANNSTNGTNPRTHEFSSNTGAQAIPIDAMTTLQASSVQGKQLFLPINESVHSVAESRDDTLCFLNHSISLKHQTEDLPHISEVSRHAQDIGTWYR